MTLIATESPVSETPSAPEAPDQSPTQQPQQGTQATLEQLFELYPKLFGAEFVPLKLGVFQELLALHPTVFDRAALKAALGVHTRSTRYLQCVARGLPRHDLQGQPVEHVAAEHVYLALMELHRRKQARSRQDLRPQLRTQLLAAFTASGLGRQDYLALVHSNDELARTLLNEAFAQLDEALARQEALCRAFEASRQSLEAFAEMYGIQPKDVAQALEQRRKVALVQ